MIHPAVEEKSFQRSRENFQFMGSKRKDLTLEI